MNMKNLILLIAVITIPLIIGIAILWSFLSGHIGYSVKTCETTSQEEANACYLRLDSFHETFMDANIIDQIDTNELIGICGSFLDECVPLIYCLKDKGTPLKMLENGVLITKKSCEAVSYFTSEFSECWESLNDKKSECLEKFYHYLNDKERKVDTPGLAFMHKVNNLRREACMNFYEETGCMKKEIVETCGERKWNWFRENVVFISKFDIGCDRRQGW